MLYRIDSLHFLKAFYKSNDYGLHKQETDATLSDFKLYLTTFQVNSSKAIHLNFFQLSSLISLKI